MNENKETYYLAVFGEVNPQDNIRTIFADYDIILANSPEEATTYAKQAMLEDPQQPMTVIKCELDFIAKSIPTYKLAPFE